MRPDSRLILPILALSVLAACAPAPAPTLTPGTRLLIANAVQASLPAHAACAGGLAFFWVGEDGRGVHQDARLLLDRQLQPPVTLPLPPTHPYDQTALALPDGSCLLFWLDAEEASDSNRLFIALLDRTLGVMRGPTTLSDAATYGYAVTLADDGTPWAAWSAGNPAEPEIRAAAIDPAGRPRPAQRVAYAVDHPAWAEDETRPSLFWLSEIDGSLWQATYSNEANSWGTATRLSSGVYRAPGDQIEAVRASQASYVWLLRRADGSREMWQTAADNSGEWRAPARVEAETAAWPETRITDARGDAYRMGAVPMGDSARLWLEPLDAGS